MQIINENSDKKLESFSENVQLTGREIKYTLEDLEGQPENWEIQLYEPNDHNPTGRIKIDHSSYCIWTEIVIVSDEDNETFAGVSYSVFRPCATDIVCESENDTFTSALLTAITVANRERKKFLDINESNNSES